MGTLSPRWQFVLPDPADNVDITQLNNDLLTVDGGLGATPCTSSTRPSTPVNGQIIREHDTGSVSIWDSTAGAWEPIPALTTVFAAGNSGSALTLSLTNGGAQTVTLTANCTISLTGATSGRASSLDLVLTQDGTGSRTVIWPATVKWAGGAAPTLSTAVGAVDRILLISYNGGTTWYGDVRGKAYA